MCFHLWKRCSVYCQQRKQVSLFKTSSCHSQSPFNQPHSLIISLSCSEKLCVLFLEKAQTSTIHDYKRAACHCTGFLISCCLKSPPLLPTPKWPLTQDAQPSCVLSTLDSLDTRVSVSSKVWMDLPLCQFGHQAGSKSYNLVSELNKACL